MDSPFLRFEATNGASPNELIHATLCTKRILTMKEQLMIEATIP